MKFKHLNEKLFDGDETSLHDFFICQIADVEAIKITDHNLIEFSKLEYSLQEGESLCIQDALGFDVVDFDGEKIFSGRKKGLGLYGYVSMRDQCRDIYILSFGECQPARFQIFLEGVLKI